MSSNPLSPIPPLGPTTGMPPTSSGGRFKPIDPIRVLRQNVKTLIVAGVMGAVLGGGVWFLMRQFSPRYTSLAQLRVMPGVASAQTISSSDSGTQLDVMKTFIQNEVMRIRSEDVLQGAIARPDVQRTSWYAQFQGDIRKAREAMGLSVLTVSSIRDTTLIQLNVSTSRADDAPVILDAIISVYLQKLRSDNTNESEGLRKAFLQEQQRADDQVRQLQAQIRDFTSSENLETLDSNRSAASIRYSQLAQMETELEMAVDSARSSAQILAKTMEAGAAEPSADDLLTMEAMPVILGLNQRINQLQELKRSYASQLGEKHRITRQYEAQIESVELDKKTELDHLFAKIQQRNVDQSQQAVSRYEGQLAQFRPKLAEAAQRMTDLTEKMTRFKQLTDLLASAKEKRAAAESKLSEIRLLVERPDAVRVRTQIGPTVPKLTSPKIATVVPGITVIVLGMVAGFVFLRELFDQHITSPMDIKLLPDVELLGVLPDAGEDSSAQGAVERVVQKDPSGLLAETYRQVRTAMLTKMDRRGYKTLMLVGDQKGVGTSSLTHNLATSLAYNGRNVLILDSNFRRPAQSVLARVHDQPGLAEVLHGSASWEKAIEKVEGTSLSVLPAGEGRHLNPEVFEGAGFRRLLGELESQFDMILIDVAPALLTSDSQMLAKHVDAIALIVRAGMDQRGMVGRMIGRLDGHRADILGVILNGVRSSAGGYFRKSYKDYYQYRNGSNPEHDRSGKASRIETDQPAAK